ncbi:MAG: disulfide oxidoreductase [Heyndrickxia sp.]
MNKALGFAWVIAIMAMLGSLYFSEIMKFTPCTLCWYQRILMYPLVIILGVAVFHHDNRVYKYVLPLSIIGMIVSIYHYSIQKVPFMKEVQVCTSGVPCSGQYINWLGFITIPLLAFIAFTLITFAMFKVRKSS